MAPWRSRRFCYALTRSSDGRVTGEKWRRALALSLSLFLLISRFICEEQRIMFRKLSEAHRARPHWRNWRARWLLCVENVSSEACRFGVLNKSVPPTFNSRGCFLGYSWDAQAGRPRWPATRVTLGNSILCGASQETTKSRLRRAVRVRVCTE